MRRTAVAAVTAALAFAAIPVAAQDTEIEPTFREERAYFHCVGDSKLQNVAAVTDGSFPWDTTAPDQSIQDGAGCGFTEYGIGGAPLDLVYTGTFSGNVDEMTVHLHEMGQSWAQPYGTEVLVTLTIDGQTRLDQESANALPTTPQNSGVTNAAEFTITGLDYAVEDGDGTRQRSFELIIGSPLRGSSTWVWDTTEVPAGITFNPEERAATRFNAS